MQLHDDWDMNPHLHPVDDETEETLKRHKAILLNHSDDFISYIHHIENERVKGIIDKEYEKKLEDFARADEIDKELAAEAHKRHELKANKSKCHIHQVEH